MNQSHEFLLRTAVLLHQYGTPSYRLERVMTSVSETIAVPAVYLYTPTALHVSLGAGDDERTYVRRVEAGDVDISKLLAFDETLEELEAGNISVACARDRLESAATAPDPFSFPVSLLAAATSCAGVAVIFGGGALETAFAGLLGIAIAMLTTLVHGDNPQRGWLEPILGFTVALAAGAIAYQLPVNDRLITLAALILPIPGLALTVALTELAVGHLSAGSARMAGAAVTLFTLVLGVAIAWRVTSLWLPSPQHSSESLPLWCLWIAVILTPLAFAVVFKAPMSQWPAIMAVSVCGFSASRIGDAFAGPEVGAFLGALVVGCGSNLYARLRNRPAMVPQTPGLLILVPGSIGYRSLTAMLDSETVKGVDLGFSMAIVGIAIVGGLLLANQLVSPKRIL